MFEIDIIPQPDDQSANLADPKPYADEHLRLGEYRPLHPKREAATLLGAVSLIAIGTKILYDKFTERSSHER